MSDPTKMSNQVLSDRPRRARARQQWLRSAWRRLVSSLKSGSPSPAPAAPPADTSAAYQPLRRALLGAGLVGAGALVARSAHASTSDQPSSDQTSSDGPDDDGAIAWGAGVHERRRWGMVIDLDRCTGCNACAIACRQENNIPDYGVGSKYKASRIEWMSMNWEPAEQGGAPVLLPFPCQHCQNPPCVKVCPVGATYKDVDGITMQIWERCIGCRYCMVACPYSRRSFGWDHPKWDGTLVQMLNPDVATRPHGVVEKCLLCHHRLKRLIAEAKLEGRELRDEDLHRMTACSSACPAEAITFGDLNDPNSAVSKGSTSPRALRLLAHLGTEPNVIYLKRDRR